jgi:pyruvate/2-oxoglutarate dehydrogenase complex dihydrolipoamide acyltransferase (E2) component
MHATKDRPVVVDGQIVIRPIMVVALTYDHRLLDGREAVTFLGKCNFVAAYSQLMMVMACYRGNVHL